MNSIKHLRLRVRIANQPREILGGNAKAQRPSQKFATSPVMTPASATPADIKPSSTAETEPQQTESGLGPGVGRKLDSEQIASKVLELMLDELRISRMRGEN